jgi:hypothetical protein
MYCDGKPISAIIDTGSQLNIVSRQVWKTQINHPIDVRRSISMNDANGGERKLQGLVENVPLTCGAVHTKTNLYVSDHVPFNLLLGRPWQCGNYASIDERQDGTWLVFKYPCNLHVTHELLCTPDGISPEWVFEPSTWLGSQSLANYLIFGEEMAIDNQSELFNSDLFSLSMAKNIENPELDQNMNFLINMLGLHNEISTTTLKILESNDIMDDVRNLDSLFEFIPTIYGIKEPRNWEMKDHPSNLPSIVPALGLPNLDIWQFSMQDNLDICAMFGTASTNQLSLNSQNSDSLTLQLHPSPIITPPASPPSPTSLPHISPPIQPAIAKTGWEEPFSPTGSPILQHLDDTKAQGGMDGQGGAEFLYSFNFAHRLTQVLCNALEHNTSLHQVMDASSLQLPALAVAPLVPEVLRAPPTPSPTPTMGADTPLPLPLFSVPSDAPSDAPFTLSHPPQALTTLK